MAPLLSFTCAFTSLAVPFLGGCYGAHALPGASAAPVAARSVAPAAPAAAGTCEGRARQPTNTTWSLDVGGRARRFVVHVPPAYDPTRATPLVLNFHGYTMSPALEDWLTEMSAKADAAGFLLVYPEGTGSPRGWNAGACCGDAMRDDVDDVAFTRAMLDRLEADLCVDARRVFVTGMSNGGFMSHRIACELGDRIAAVAPVAGVNGLATCAPPRAVSVMQFHGTADPTIPYDGKPKNGWRAVPESTAAWAERDGCTSAPVETEHEGNVRCVTYGGCRDGADVSLCTVSGGGHTWPGGKDIPGVLGQGATTHDARANDIMWSFFLRHPLPPRPDVAAPAPAPMPVPAGSGAPLPAAGGAVAPAAITGR